MRKSEYYGVNVPELGDRADITVVSQAIIDSENNQSGKVENMKATVSGTIISLTSETRQDALLKYYNGLAVQFISPVDASAGSSYKIKIGSLTEQPYNNKVDIKVGDIVQAIYGSTGFISANTPIPRSSSVDSSSETTVATSMAVKQAYDKGKEGLDKANTKLDAGSVSVDYNTGRKIEDKIKEKLDKTGGDVSGLLSIKSEPFSEIQFKNSDSNHQGAVGAYYTDDNATGYVFLRNNQLVKAAKLRLYQNGNTELDAGNLTTPQKEVIGAINGIYAGTQIYRRQLTGVVDFNTITEPGIYDCRNIDRTSFKNANDKTPIVGRIHPWGCFEVIPFGSGNILQRFTPVSTIECLTTITRVKYYDQSWGIWIATIHQNSREFNSFIGITGAVEFSFIQDEGVKNVNSLYYDNATFALYRCKNRTEDVSVTANFEKVSILDNLNKIKSLITTSEITSTQRISTDNGLEWYFGVTNPNKVISVVLPDIKGCQLESYVIDKENNKIYVTSTFSIQAPESITIKVVYLNI